MVPTDSKFWQHILTFLLNLDNFDHLSRQWSSVLFCVNSSDQQVASRFCFCCLSAAGSGVTGASSGAGATGAAGLARFESGEGDFYTQGMSVLCPLDDEHLPMEAANLKNKQVGLSESQNGCSRGAACVACGGLCELKSAAGVKCNL